MDLRLNTYSGIKILYVDRDQEIVSAFYHAMVDTCTGVITFTNLGLALATLRQDTAEFAVAISDVDIEAEGDGIQFLRQVAEAAPLVTRVILTNNMGELVKARARAENAYHHWCGKELLADQSALENLIFRSVDQYAQRCVGRLIQTHRATMANRMRQRNIDHRRIKLRLWPIVRVCSLLMPYLDIPVVDQWLLRLAANYYNLGHGDGASQICGKRITAGVLEDLRGMEKIHEAVLDWMERWDGSGPTGKCGEAICLFGRIIAVLHAFDQGISGPPHDDLSPLDTRISQSLAYLHASAGTLYDPQIARAFIQMVQECREKVKELYKE